MLGTEPHFKLIHFCCFIPHIGTLSSLEIFTLSRAVNKQLIEIIYMEQINSNASKYLQIANVFGLIMISDDFRLAGKS